MRRTFLRISAGIMRLSSPVRPLGAVCSESRNHVAHPSHGPAIGGPAAILRTIGTDVDLQQIVALDQARNPRPARHAAAPLDREQLGARNGANRTKRPGGVRWIRPIRRTWIPTCPAVNSIDSVRRKGVAQPAPAALSRAPGPFCTLPRTLRRIAIALRRDLAKKSVEIPNSLAPRVQVADFEC